MKEIRFWAEKSACKKKAIIVLYSDFEKLRFNSCLKCGRRMSVCSFRAGFSNPTSFNGDVKYGTILLLEEEIKMIWTADNGLLKAHYSKNGKSYSCEIVKKDLGHILRITSNTDVTKDIPVIGNKTKELIESAENLLKEL